MKISILLHKMQTFVIRSPSLYFNVYINVFGPIPTTTPALQIVEKFFRVAFEPQGVPKYNFWKIFF